jgi:hypothetical protein
MFRWFKRKAIERIIRDSGAGKMLDQLAFAVAVSEVASEYIRTNKNLPICKARDTNVKDMWIGTRLEAISLLWNCGAANIELITSPTKHPQLLDDIIKRNPFLPSLQPIGDEIEDTMSAIARVYDYLDRLERDVAVPFHSIIQDGLGSISKYASFVLEMQKLLVKWQAFEYAVHHNAARPDQPETIFMPLWRDVTFKAKMISLCGVFGPSYMAMQAHLRNLARVDQRPVHAQYSLNSLDNTFVKILFADDPDQIRGTPHSIGSHSKK